jgi:phosphocarrier protein FPr
VAGASEAIVTIVNTHGLHARPAALLVAEVQRWDATVRLRNLTTASPWAAGESLARVAALGAAKGHQLEVSASGRQAQPAVYAIVALVGSGFGAAGDDDAAVAEAEAAGVSAGPGSPPGVMPAAPGYAVGRIRHLSGGPLVVPTFEPGTPEEHHARLAAALDATRRALEANRDQAERVTGKAEAAIFDAHVLMLRDPAILEDAGRRIDAGGGAAGAWQAAMGRVARQIASLGDDYLRARAADVRGVGDQVLRELLGVAPAEVSGKGILVVADLAPTQAAALDPKQVRGIVLAGGSPTSHAAILARSKGIAMVTGAGIDVVAHPEGTRAVLDGSAGRFVVDPGEETIAAYKARVRDRRHALKRAAKRAQAPARMADGGPRIPVMANIGSPADAEHADGSGADGFGLVRTEFLFQETDTPPGRAEQEAIYRAIAESAHGRPVIFRTLDAGGDNPLPYLAMAHEDNPFLGVRGVRLSLCYPEVFADQLEAFAAVARDHPIQIMFPMVATIAELRRARVSLARAAFRQGGSFPEGLKVGIMIEVPSAALKAASFAPTVDFFSVGTNDLTQYALAADRGNPLLAGLADGLDPGVLGLIEALCRSARGRATVSVCGELASDPAAVPVLLGLGVRSLSTALPAVGEVKDAVRSITKRAARSLARQALVSPDAATVRGLLTAPRSED